ncbi:MAG: hypothetical protein RXO32_03100 [Thermoproteus sp.]
MARACVSRYSARNLSKRAGSRWTCRTGTTASPTALLSLSQ